MYGEGKQASHPKDADRYGKEFGLPLAYDKSADEKSWNDFINNLNQL